MQFKEGEKVEIKERVKSSLNHIFGDVTARHIKDCNYIGTIHKYDGGKRYKVNFGGCIREMYNDELNAKTNRAKLQKHYAI